MQAMPGPSTSPRVLVIVPAWNEQDSVGATVREIRETNPDVDILVVDDGSGDDTVERAAAAGAEVCRLPFNLGVGGAMRTGYRYALRHGYDVAVQIDADGQHDPRYLPTLIAGLDDADIVIGARFARTGDPYVVRGPRRWAMVLLARVLSRLSHTRLTDVTSGFRASDKRAIAVFASHYPAEYLGDTVESLVIAVRTGCRVTQVPVDMRSRSAGQPSSSPLRSAVYLLRAVVALGLALVRRWEESFDEGATRTSVVNPDQVVSRMSAVNVLGIAGALITLVALFEMLRRHRLREKYALIWFVIAVGVFVVALFPVLLERATSLLGLQVPANLLFFIASLVLLILTLQHSYELGRVEERTRTLAEEIALLRLELERATRRSPDPPPADPTHR